MLKKYQKRIPVVRPDFSVAASPGILSVPAGSVASRVTIIGYGPENFFEEKIQDLSRLRDLASAYHVLWINVSGLGTLETLHQLGEQFGLHRLAMEDVLSIPQRPKLDDYGDHQYIVARMPVAHEYLHTEQLSIFLGKNFVITLQEQPGDCFEGIRSRLRDGRLRIRESGPDYLVYAVLDALVDSYYPLLEHLGVTLDELEGEIHSHPQKQHIHNVHLLERELVTLRRYLWPLRELILSLLRPENEFLTDHTRLFMRDCYDHSAHALDLVDAYRDIASGLADSYLSMVNQRMNEVMKFLTIVATLFIPLSFIAGLYGMNFDPAVSRWNMPELSWAFGYPFALGIMCLCAGAMLFYFWKRGWFR